MRRGLVGLRRDKFSAVGGGEKVEERKKDGPIRDRMLDVVSGPRHAGILGGGRQHPAFFLDTAAGVSRSEKLTSGLKKFSLSYSSLLKHS